MNPLSRLSAIALFSCGLGLFPPPIAKSQVVAPSRVVRLSRAEGQVLVSHPGSDTWEEAAVNLPLQEGDRLATQAGLAEFEFENGATGYLAENSTLQFTQLGFANGGRTTELTLSGGAGTFYANLTSQDSFRVATSTFEVAIPTRAEFRVDAFTDGAAVGVLAGEVSVTTAKGSASLAKGESVAVHERDFQDLNNIARLPEQDAFDQWVSEESEIIRSGNKNTLSYINSPNLYGLSDLSIYGTWVSLSGFGLTWRPYSSGLGWAPFINGVWTLDPRLGWIWVSNDAWGWIPYHFGSWFLSPTLGWVWVPGGTEGLRQWEPARVNWVSFGNQVGWVAKSPLDREGAPANLASGVVMRQAPTRGSQKPANETVAAKGLQSATVLREPPKEFASRPLVGSQRSGISSRARAPMQGADHNASIAYDPATHTFVNREESETGNTSRVPGASTTFVPRKRTSEELPKASSSATRPTETPGNHAALPGVLPANPTSRVGNTANTPPAARPLIPAPATPTNPGPPAAPTPRPAPVQSNPAARPAPPQPPAQTRPQEPPPHAKKEL